MGIGVRNMIPTMEMTIANLKTLSQEQYTEIAATIAAMKDSRPVSRKELDDALDAFCDKYDEALRALAK